jgi:HEAT repeat protein
MPPPPAAPFALAFGSPQQFGRELVALLEKRALDEAERRAGAADPELLRSAMGAREVAVLTDLYRTLPPHGRSLAAWLIAHSPDTGATSALTWSLEREEEEDVRMALARALGRRTEQEAAMALCLRLETDSSPGVRVASAHALAHAAARDPLALRALARCVETDANAAVGAAAATALGQVPSSEAAAALVVGLRSSAVDVRVAAAGALGGHAGRIRPEEVAALEANEKDPRVREALRVAGEALRGELSMPEVEGRPRKKE